LNGTKQEKVGSEWGPMISEEYVDCPGIGIMKLEKIKEAVAAGAYVKKWGQGSWVWAIPIVQQVVTKSDPLKQKKVGDQEWVVSQNYLNWEAKQRAKDKALFLNKESLNDIQETGRDNSLTELEQFFGTDSGPRLQGEVSSESDNTSDVEKLPF
jgi:hypothetical protein